MSILFTIDPFIGTYRTSSDDQNQPGFLHHILFLVHSFVCSVVHLFVLSFIPLFCWLSFPSISMCHLPDLISEKFPNVTTKPRIQVHEGAHQSVVFTCSFPFTASNREKARFQVNWFRPVKFYGGNFGRISLFSEQIRESPSTYRVNLGGDIPLGITVSYVISSICEKLSLISFLYKLTVQFRYIYCLIFLRFRKITGRHNQ